MRALLGRSRARELRPPHARHGIIISSSTVQQTTTAGIDALVTLPLTSSVMLLPPHVTLKLLALQPGLCCARTRNALGEANMAARRCPTGVVSDANAPP